MEFSITKRRSSSRRGLSFVEFVGCLLAMIGGVLLGSLYLGVDVQKMAVGVLEQAQVIAPGYFNQLVAKTTDGPATTADSQSPSNTQESAGAAKGDATAESAPAADPANASVGGAFLGKTEPSPEERQQSTRAYWDQLTAIMHSEIQGRQRGGNNPGQWEFYDYLMQRKRGHEEALAKIEKLDDLGVDERLLNHGDQVMGWHKAGIKLFDNALSLISDGPGAKLTGPFAQSWQSAATQLRMEENLVVERHKAIANYLNREYASAAPFVPAFQRR
jgi:hypothetical protein